LFTKKLGYGGSDYPFSLRQGLDYGAQSFPVAEATDKEVFWLTDALPILTRDDLDDAIAAVEKVAASFLSRAGNAA
jgi:hypothetical protein